MSDPERFSSFYQIGPEQYPKENMAEEKKFYTVQEATGILGISEKELMRFIDDNKIPVLKVGRALRISEESIANFLKESGSSENEEDKESLQKDLKEVFAEDVLGEDDNDFQDDRDSDSRTKRLQEECEKLIEKKQELEEDINYLQIEYEEFRSKIKKLVVEELKTFLKKVDNGKIDLEERSFKE
jgi:excisionase family DNA binding protein